MRISRRMVLAGSALTTAVVIGGGTAYAATAATSSPAPNRVCYNATGQLKAVHGTSCPSGWKTLPSNLFPRGPVGPRGATGATGARGPAGTTGATGKAGPTGPAGTPILYESTGNSTPDLAIDMAPGPDGNAGAGGWGWNSTANKPVTNLTVGTNATFVVTLVQPNTAQANGTITLTYDPYDFKLVTPPADGTCSVISQTQQETCSFTDLSHSAVSKPFVFAPQHANPDAQIGVTAILNGQEATANFPVKITG